MLITELSVSVHPGTMGCTSGVSKSDNLYYQFILWYFGLGGGGDCYVKILFQETGYRYIILDQLNPHFSCYVIVVAKDCPKSYCERKCVVFVSLWCAFSDLSRGCHLHYFCSVWCCDPLQTDGSNRFQQPSL